MKALATKYLDFIVGATNRMQLLIKDLLDYSRIGIDKNRVQLGCNLLISKVLQIIQKSTKSSCCEAKLGETPTIYAYPKLFSLSKNLLSNTLKFRKKNEGLSVHISARCKKNDWIFKIQDNGMGIEKQYQDQIFTLFQKIHSQKEYPSAGIGLAHCKKIVWFHGSSIGVELEPGKGSTFWFTIPKTS